MAFPPPTEARWKEIAKDFWERWGFPNCLGAIDGKHVAINAPAHSGSVFYNHKQTFSVVLLALVDAHYRFIYVQVGEFGRASDGGVFASSAIGEGMEKKTLNVPPPSALPNSENLGPLPYVMVGDAAFPLKTYLMRPFPGRLLPQWRETFNDRLSTARKVVECAFGILTSRWRVVLNRLQMSPDYVDSVVMAACILHNFLMTPAQAQRWLEEAEGMRRRLREHRNMGGHRGRREAYAVREKYAAFFISPEGRRRR